MEKKKVIFIAPALLPIPSIKGGGIEQLITNLINQNEIFNQMEITVISVYNIEAIEAQKKYIHTKFQNTYNFFFSRIINFLNRNIFSKIFRYPYYHFGIIQMIWFLKKATFDQLINFSNDEYIKPLSIIVPKTKLIHYDASLLLGKINDFALCNKILVGSDHSKSTYLKQGRFFSEDDFRIIHSGIDTGFFRNFKNTEFRNEMRSKLGISSSTLVFCFTGRLVESKGIIVTLKAFNLLPKDYNFKLICIGSFGSSFGMANNKTMTLEEIKITELANQLGDKCLFTGYLNDLEFEKYLSVIDVGLVPTLDEEVSPLVYFQYQSMGVPSIVSDSGGIPNFYSSSHSIMVYRGPSIIEDIKSAIEYMILNTDEVDEMGLHALKNRDYLDVSRYYHDFIKIIN